MINLTMTEIEAEIVSSLIADRIEELKGFRGALYEIPVLESIQLQIWASRQAHYKKMQGMRRDVSMENPH